MINWHKENAKDLSFYGIKDDIKYTTSSLLPYELNIAGVKYEVSCCEELQFKNAETDEVVEIPEMDFFEIWDRARKQGVFSSEDLSYKEKLLFYLLSDMNYMTKIKIQDNNTGIMQNGYQINEGSGRVYSFKEN